MATDLVLQGLLSYTVQSAGQLMTARVRSDLFDHALGLDLRFHMHTPMGLLLTRLTSDVEAVAEMFGNGAIGVLAELVALLVIRIRTHNMRNGSLTREGAPTEHQEEMGDGPVVGAQRRTG